MHSTLVISANAEYKKASYPLSVLHTAGSLAKPHRVLRPTALPCAIWPCGGLRSVSSLVHHEREQREHQVWRGFLDPCSKRRFLTPVFVSYAGTSDRDVFGMFQAQCSMGSAQVKRETRNGTDIIQEILPRTKDFHRACGPRSPTDGRPAHPSRNLEPTNVAPSTFGNAIRH